METRKIQRVGVSTLTISLPKAWAEGQNLRKGDQVFIVEEGDTLKLMAPEGARRRMERPVPDYVIDADSINDPGMMERIVVGNYVLGRERIIVKSATRLRGEHLEEIRNVAKRLMGLGIIEETGDKAVLQCSLEPSKFPIESLVKRLFNLGKTMLGDAIEALITKDATLARDAIRREDDADMMYWLIVRLVLSAQQDDSLIAKLGMETKLNNAGYRLIAKELETVADCANTIAQNVQELVERQTEFDWSILKVLKEGADEAAALYGNGLAALITRDVKLANKTVLDSQGLEGKLRDFMTVLFKKVEDPQELMALKTIVDNLAQIAGYSKSIANIAFNRYLERSTPLSKEVERSPRAA